MSVDVYIGDENFNYTHNTAALWHEHLLRGEVTGFAAIDGLTGKDAFLLLKESFDHIQETRLRHWDKDSVGEPEFCAKYDSPNGWGSAVGGLLFMAQVMAACAANPRKRVHVSL